MQQDTALLGWMETGWGEAPGCCYRADNTQGGLHPTCSFYLRRPLDAHQRVGKLLSDIPRTGSHLRGMADPQALVLEQGPQGGLAPQARYGQRTRYSKSCQARRTGRCESGDLHLAPRTLLVTQSRSGHPPPTLLGSPCTACPDSCWEPWNAAPFAG